MSTPPEKLKSEYINNENFLAELVKYKEKVKQHKKDGLPKPRIPEYIGECFFKISHNLSKRPNFCCYSFKDEMISDAIENCLLYFENFDETKSNNPFSYFTTVCWWAFVRRIAKEKKQQYIKYKATESFGTLNEEELGELKEMGVDIDSPQIYDNLSTFIRDYENSLEKKKENIKKKKGIELFTEE